jgi:hypothetical protein
MLVGKTYRSADRTCVSSLILIPHFSHHRNFKTRPNTYRFKPTRESHTFGRRSSIGWSWPKIRSSMSLLRPLQLMVPLRESYAKTTRRCSLPINVRINTTKTTWLEDQFYPIPRRSHRFRLHIYAYKDATRIGSLYESSTSVIPHVWRDLDFSKLATEVSLHRALKVEYTQAVYVKPSAGWMKWAIKKATRSREG